MSTSQDNWDNITGEPRPLASVDSSSGLPDNLTSLQTPAWAQPAAWTQPQFVSPPAVLGQPVDQPLADLSGGIDPTLRRLLNLDSGGIPPSPHISAPVNAALDHRGSNPGTNNSVEFESAEGGHWNPNQTTAFSGGSGNTTQPINTNTGQHVNLSSNFNAEGTTLDGNDQSGLEASVGSPNALRGLLGRAKPTVSETPAKSAGVPSFSGFHSFDEVTNTAPRQSSFGEAGSGVIGRAEGLPGQAEAAISGGVSSNLAGGISSLAEGARNVGETVLHAPGNLAAKLSETLGAATIATGTGTPDNANEANEANWTNGHGAETVGDHLGVSNFGPASQQTVFGQSTDQDANSQAWLPTNPTTDWTNTPSASHYGTAQSNSTPSSITQTPTTQAPLSNSAQEDHSAWTHSAPAWTPTEWTSTPATWAPPSWQDAGQPGQSSWPSAVPSRPEPGPEQAGVHESGFSTFGASIPATFGVTTSAPNPEFSPPTPPSWMTSAQIPAQDVQALLTGAPDRFENIKYSTWDPAPQVTTPLATAPQVTTPLNTAQQITADQLMAQEIAAGQFSQPQTHQQADQGTHQGETPWARPEASQAMSPSATELAPHEVVGFLPDSGTPIPPVLPSSTVEAEEVATKKRGARPKKKEKNAVSAPEFAQPNATRPTETAETSDASDSPFGKLKSSFAKQSEPQPSLVDSMSEKSILRLRIGAAIFTLLGLVLIGYLTFGRATTTPQVPATSTTVASTPLNTPIGTAPMSTTPNTASLNGTASSIDATTQTTTADGTQAASTDVTTDTGDFFQPGQDFAFDSGQDFTPK